MVFSQALCIYSTSPLFLWWHVGIIFHILTGSCKMMFLISYFVYSVNSFVSLLITQLVYSKTYRVCLLITTRANQTQVENITGRPQHSRQGIIKNPCAQAMPFGSGTINPCLPHCKNIWVTSTIFWSSQLHTCCVYFIKGCIQFDSKCS